MSNVKFQTNKKDTIWTNAFGDSVPFKFVPQSDKIKEELGVKIHKEAIKIEGLLNNLHILMNEARQKINTVIREEYELKNKKSLKVTKGSFTWYNFDKSLKVECEMNDIVKWDSSLMTEALNLFNKFLEKSLNEEAILIKGLINSAFSNTKGMIDTGKVFQILKHEDKINNPNFQKACELIRNAQNIDRTKLYMRVWEKSESGEYRNINLNFSSI